MMMDYEQIKYQLENSASIKLLRSPNAALILSFLYKQFKENHQISIAQSDLETKLEDYLEFINEQDNYTNTSIYYLNQWCENGWLKKTFEQEDDPIFKLTPDSEKSIRWLEDLQIKANFIGTESRFFQIFDLLKQIQDYSTTDVETRINQLEQEKQRLEQEIANIRRTGVFKTFNQTRLQDNFQLANEMAKQLLSDFRGIEQNFRELAENVQKAHLESNISKGSVMGQVLDEYESLRNSDQGRSFYAFFDFLISDIHQQELESLIETVYTLEELQPLTNNNQQLKQMKSNLMNEAENIMKSNDSLAAKLRQMLKENYLKENRRITDTIITIQRLALEIVKAPLPDENFCQIEGYINISLPIDRPLYLLENSEKLRGTDFSNLDEILENDEDINQLYEQFYIDEERLKQQIEELLNDRLEITLVELTEYYPVEQGLSEIVAYLKIGTESEQHLVNNSIMESMVIRGLEGSQMLQLTLPQIIFRRNGF